VPCSAPSSFSCCVVQQLAFCVQHRWVCPNSPSRRLWWMGLSERQRQCRINANRSPWQLFPRGPYLHDTFLGYLWSRYQYGPFLFFVVAEVMSNCLTIDGLKKNSLLPEAPLRPEAHGICHICHMVNPALVRGGRFSCSCVDSLFCVTVFDDVSVQVFDSFWLRASNLSWNADAGDV